MDTNSGSTRVLSPHFSMASPQRDEPRALQNISALINERFRISPTITQDPFRPQLVSPQEELYSPTSPFNISTMDPVTSSSTAASMLTQQVPQQSGTNLQTHSRLFSGKKRRKSPLGRSHSFDSMLLPYADVIQAREKHRRRRLEDWEVKGAFTLWLPGHVAHFSSKAITDTLLAKDL